MYDKSERAYSWIEAKSARLGKWIDSNLARLMIIVVFTGLAIWGFLLEEQENLSMGQRLVRSLGPSLAGIVIAAVTIEVLAERRMEQERKAQLIRQLGSKYRDVTEMAIIELRHKGWLEDGSLSGTQLMEADLSGADLTAANMSGASLLAVNLSRADLCGVDLSDTNLQRAELSGASLKQANLSEAYFWTIEQLQETKTLEAATMPDGVMLRREEAVLEVAPNVAFQLSRTDGPTFEVWKAEYLRKYGGTVRDIRSRFESDYELRS